MIFLKKYSVIGVQICGSRSRGKCLSRAPKKNLQKQQFDHYKILTFHYTNVRRKVIREIKIKLYF